MNNLEIEKRFNELDLRFRLLQSFVESELKGPSSTVARADIAYRERFAHLEHAIFGNGDEGLKVKVTRLVLQMKQVTVLTGFAAGAAIGVLVERLLS